MVYIFIPPCIYGWSYTTGHDAQFWFVAYIHFFGCVVTIAFKIISVIWIYAWLSFSYRTKSKLKLWHCLKYFPLFWVEENEAGHIGTMAVLICIYSCIVKMQYLCIFITTCSSREYLICLLTNALADIKFISSLFPHMKQAWIRFDNICLAVFLLLTCSCYRSSRCRSRQMNQNWVHRTI